jgi:hypothetical protein
VTMGGNKEVLIKSTAQAVPADGVQNSTKHLQRNLVGRRG